MSARRRSVTAFVASLAALLIAACAAAPGHARATKASRPSPNVVILLADDAGYADFGFQGSRDIATPNIDRLAASGVVYRQAYATTPFCSPSRAGLLTGRHPLRYGYEYNLTHAPPPGVDAAFMGLPVEERTMGDYFKDAGYRTIAIGKWHVGSQPRFHPNARGFDHFYGLLGGGSRYFPDAIKPGEIERNGRPALARTYLTDDFALEAVEQITKTSGPFLLYLAFTAPHTPMDAKPEDMARFSHIADPQRRRLAAMTWAMDRAIGNVLESIRQKSAERDTLIIFTNDNGGDRIGLDASNAPLRGTKGTLLEGGIRVPLVVRFPGGLGAGNQVSNPVSLLDIVPTALAALGLTPPRQLDGRVLRIGDPRDSPRTLHWRYDTVAAMRSGVWKLLRFPDRPPQLYRLDLDVGEERDLAVQERGRVADMMRQLFAWEATVEHPRWHTGTFWSQEDIRRYSDVHVRNETNKAKAALSMPVKP